MTLRALVALVLGGLLAPVGCSSSSVRAGPPVTAARILLLDANGGVTASVDIVSEGNVGSSVVLPQNALARFRVVWLNDEGVPEPGATDPSLQLKVQLPPGHGLSFTVSGSAQYEGTLAGTVLQPVPVFVPMMLFDARQQRDLFTVLVPVEVH